MGRADSNVRPPFSKWDSPDRVRRPSDLSATVFLEIYATFEVQPILSAGMQIRRLAVTVEQLLDRSAKVVCELGEVLHEGLGTHTMVAFTLFPEDGEVGSPCSSILVTVKRQKWENSDSLTSKVLGPHCVSTQLVSTWSSMISVCS